MNTIKNKTLVNKQQADEMAFCKIEHSHLASRLLPLNSVLCIISKYFHENF